VKGTFLLEFEKGTAIRFQCLSFLGLRLLLSFSPVPTFAPPACKIKAAGLYCPRNGAKQILHE